MKLAYFSPHILGLGSWKTGALILLHPAARSAGPEKQLHAYINTLHIVITFKFMLQRMDLHKCCIFPYPNEHTRTLIESGVLFIFTMHFRLRAKCAHYECRSRAKFGPGPNNMQIDPFRPAGPAGSSGQTLPARIASAGPFRSETFGNI